MKVFAWPPFQLTGWELAEVYPQSRSVGLIEGRPRTSSAQRGRRVATAHVTGIGTDAAGAGFVRMLNRQWAGQSKLVRVECHSALWHMYRGRNDLRGNVLSWTDGGIDLLWSSGGAPIVWGMGDFSLYGIPETDGEWHGLALTGLPPGQIVARPSELISITDGDTIESAYVLTVARSDEAAAAIIRTDKPEAFTMSGLVSLGHAENVVFEAQGVPRAVQGLSGTYGFQWDFIEVFEDEFADGWQEVNPWD